MNCSTSIYIRPDGSRRTIQGLQRQTPVKCKRAETGDQAGRLWYLTKAGSGIAGVSVGFASTAQHVEVETS